MIAVFSAVSFDTLRSFRVELSSCSVPSAGRLPASLQSLLLYLHNLIWRQRDAGLTHEQPVAREFNPRLSVVPLNETNFIAGCHSSHHKRHIAHQSRALP
jgi:hypothetical protein